MSTDHLTPLVSVIVPCYNCAPFLKETLDSIANQTYSNLECIIVDNGSTDHSKEIAEQYSKKDERFTAVLQPIKGVSNARNKGIAISKGKYILPVDADDKIAPGYIEKAVRVLEDHPEIKLVYCEAELFGESSGKWNLPPFSMQQMLVENIIFSAACFRRSDYKTTNGYNELMVTGFEDWDFWLDLIRKEEEVFRIPEVLFFYRIRKNSRNDSLDEEKQRMLRRQIYENHKELYHTPHVSDLLFEYYLVKTKYNSLINASSYKIGKIILGPVYYLLKLLKK